MKASGYSWDPERKKWFRGDPKTRDRRAAECRSSSRVVRFVDAKGEAAVCGPAVRKATRHLEKTLQAARTEALDSDNDKSRAFNLELKDKLASAWAPYAWTATQLILGVLLIQACGTIDWGASAALNEVQWAGDWSASRAFSDSNLDAVLLGIAFAPPLVVSQRRLRELHAGAGVEGSVGQLERLLADSALGSHALPAPWEWRSESAAWRRLALLLELVASSNALVALHGLAQPALSVAISRGTLTMLLVSNAADTPIAPYAALAAPALAVCGAALLPALSELYFFGDPLLDGLPAELEAAKRVSKNAEAYFSMTAAASDTPAAVAVSAAAARSLAAGWQDRFGSGGSAQQRAAMAAAAAAIATALTGFAWQLSGSLLAPLVANAVATADAYLLSASADASRRDVQLPSECEGH